MLEYDRIDVSEGIDVSKTDGLCERIICYILYFLETKFRLSSDVCDVFINKKRWFDWKSGTI